MSLFHFDLNSIKGAKNSIFFGFSKKVSLRKLSRVQGDPNLEFWSGKKGGNHLFENPRGELTHSHTMADCSKSTKNKPQDESGFWFHGKAQSMHE